MLEAAQSVVCNVRQLEELFQACVLEELLPPCAESDGRILKMMSEQDIFHFGSVDLFIYFSRQDYFVEF